MLPLQSHSVDGKGRSQYQHHGREPSIWYGIEPHLTYQIANNILFAGGYPKFVTQGFNEKYIPVWLQQAGYNMYYTGKLFNVHTVENYDSPYPAGFTGTVCASLFPEENRDFGEFG